MACAMVSIENDDMFDSLKEVIEEGYKCNNEARESDKISTYYRYEELNRSLQYVKNAIQVKKQIDSLVDDIFFKLKKSIENAKDIAIKNGCYNSYSSEKIDMAFTIYKASYILAKEMAKNAKTSVDKCIVSMNNVVQDWKTQSSTLGISLSRLKKHSCASIRAKNIIKSIYHPIELFCSSFTIVGKTPPEIDDNISFLIEKLECL